MLSKMLVICFFNLSLELGKVCRFHSSNVPKKMNTVAVLYYVNITSRCHSDSRVPFILIEVRAYHTTAQHCTPYSTVHCVMDAGEAQ